MKKSLITAAVVAGTVVLVIRMLPDIQRYLRMSRM